MSDGGNRVFGPGPADLLERVGELGSLRAAAISMGMAYTKATRIVREAEEAFGFPLTERTVGGAGGGGSRLTAEARELVERYRSFERTSEAALATAYATCFAGFAGVRRLGCVVMASGAAARFGGAPGEKLTAPLAGVPVLERTLSALPADLLDVVVERARRRGGALRAPRRALRGPWRPAQERHGVRRPRRPRRACGVPLRPR